MYKLQITTSSKKDELYVELNESAEWLTDIMKKYLDDMALREKIRNTFDTNYLWFELFELDRMSDRWNSTIKFIEFL